MITKDQLTEIHEILRMCSYKERQIRRNKQSQGHYTPKDHADKRMLREIYSKTLTESVMRANQCDLIGDKSTLRTFLIHQKDISNEFFTDFFENIVATQMSPFLLEDKDHVPFDIIVRLHHQYQCDIPIRLVEVIRKIDKLDIAQEDIEYCKQYISEHDYVEKYNHDYTSPAFAISARRLFDICAIVIGGWLSNSMFIECVRLIGKRKRFSRLIEWHCDHYDAFDKFAELQLKGLI